MLPTFKFQKRQGNAKFHGQDLGTEKPKIDITIQEQNKPKSLFRKIVPCSKTNTKPA